MRKLLKYSLSLLVSLTMVWTVKAVESGSIYIDYHYEEEGLAQVTFHLYQVYEVDTSLDYIPTEDFQDLGSLEDFSDNELWLKQSQKAENYVNVNQIQPTISDMTDDLGRAVVEGMDQGIYLLKFDKKNLNDYAYESDPVLLMIPGSLDGTNEWAQSIIPKVSAYPEEGPVYHNIAVMKQWRGDNAEVRPTAISIALYNSGVLVDTVALSAENSWSYYWENLDGNGNWGVKELDIPYKYTSEVTFEKYIGTTVYYVENTYDTQVGGGGSVGVGGGTGVEGDGYDTDVEGDLVQTGAVLLPIPVLFFTGVVLIVSGLLLRKDSHEEI